MNAPKPGSPEWARLVTASKCAGILGVSPWSSPFSTWQTMKGNVEPEPQTEVMSRGLLLEGACLAWWRDRHNVTWHKTQVARRIGDWGLATIDMLARDCHGDLAVVEAKTASRDDGWGCPPDAGSVPAHYLAQVLFQLAATPNAARAYVVLLTAFLEFHEYVVERSEFACEIESVTRACKTFWDSLEADDPPPLDDTVATYQAVRKLHPDIERGDTAVVPNSVGDAYTDADDALTAAQAAHRKAKTELLALAGRAQHVETVDGRLIATRRAAARGAVALYRNKEKNQ